MGTEILRPQNCLFNGVRVSPAACYRRRYGGNQNWSYNDNDKINRKPPVQRKRSDPSISKRSSSVDDLKAVRKNLVREKVTILRRGESIGLRTRSSDSLRREVDGVDLVVTGTDRLGPDLEMVPRQIQIQIQIVEIRSEGKPDMYAGSAFAVSPAPSALPLPSFSTKKQAPLCDSATRDLRRLLRLDL